MPFRSQAQARYLRQNHPEIAERWQKESGQDISTLPEHAPKVNTSYPQKPSKLSKKRKYDGRSRGMKRLGLKKRDMM